MAYYFLSVLTGMVYYFTGTSGLLFFWHVVYFFIDIRKYEEVYLKDYVNPRDARRGINNYLNL
ncbi:hypothetical protein, partial [Sporolactobacillus inulinus]